MGKPALSCRGCLANLDMIDFYSLAQKKVKDLFTKCTSIEVGKYLRHSDALFISSSLSLSQRRYRPMKMKAFHGKSAGTAT